MTAEAGVTLKDRVIAIVCKAEEPMSFEAVYEAVSQDGYPLPEDKPKLRVRKILYNADLFESGVSGFLTKPGVTATVPEAPPGLVTSPPEPQPKPKPKPKSTASSRPRPKKEESTLGLIKGIASSLIKPTPPAKSSKPASKPAPKKKAASPPAPTGPTRKMSDRIITILEKATAPMNAESIYAALLEDGYVMPADKPKLVVRKTLYNTELFASDKGLFTVQSGVTAGPAPEPPAAAPAAAAEAPPPTPASEPKPADAGPVSAAPPTPTASMDADVAAAAREAAIEAAKEAAREAAQAAVAEAMKTAREAAQAAGREAAAAAADQAKELAAEAARSVVASITPVAEAPPPKTTEGSETSTASGAPRAESKGGSIRERAAAAIFKQNRPLGLQEILDALRKDGFPMPEKNVKKIVQRVLDNPELFATNENGEYIPMVEAE